MEKPISVVWSVRVSGEQTRRLGGGQSGGREFMNVELRTVHCWMPLGVRHGSGNE